MSIEQTKSLIYTYSDSLENIKYDEVFAVSVANPLELFSCVFLIGITTEKVQPTTYVIRDILASADFRGFWQQRGLVVPSKLDILRVEVAKKNRYNFLRKSRIDTIILPLWVDAYSREAAHSKLYSLLNRMSSLPAISYIIEEK